MLPEDHNPQRDHEQPSETYKVLSIDAWADTIDGDISWSWNNWHFFDTYLELENGALNLENAAIYFQGQLTNSDDVHTKYDIEDDQYNYVLIRKDDGMPILAIEYGGKL